MEMYIYISKRYVEKIVRNNLECEICSLLFPSYGSSIHLAAVNCLNVASENNVLFSMGVDQELLACAN